MRKHTKITASLNASLGLSLLKHPISFHPFQCLSWAKILSEKFPFSARPYCLIHESAASASNCRLGFEVCRHTLGLKPKTENYKPQWQVPASEPTQPLFHPSMISECTSQAVNWLILLSPMTVKASWHTSKFCSRLWKHYKPLLTAGEMHRSRQI